MSVDPELLEGLQAAVAAAPGNLALRVHAAALLLEAGRPAEALAQCGVVLESAPDHQQALEVAARAADATGDHEQALEYRRRRRPVAEGQRPVLVVARRQPVTAVDQTRVERHHVEQLLAARRPGPGRGGGPAVLQARRLVEAGVPLVTVFWQNDGLTNVSVYWDTHNRNFLDLKTGRCRGESSRGSPGGRSNQWLTSPPAGFPPG
jgi:hypothetical protein